MVDSAVHELPRCDTVPSAAAFVADMTLARGTTMCRLLNHIKTNVATGGNIAWKCHLRTVGGAA